MNTKTIYALGFFDGVHIGHGALLRACKQMAQAQGCCCGAVTFTAHPDALVSGTAPELINTPADRRMLMQQLYGIDCIVELPFDNTMRNTSWQTFYRMLCSRYHAAGFVCGHDFRFGKGGAGTGALLQESCRQDGLACMVIPEQKLSGITVSSSYIRGLLQQGDIRQANAFLGHPHVFTGIVVPGQQLGRTLGTPTANLLLPDTLLCPKFGVYACIARLENRRFPAVTNIGCRPTVDGKYVTVEAWLLGYSGDLYGKALTLEFHDFLREEKKFDSLAALQEEIQKNAAQTLEFFQKR